MQYHKRIELSVVGLDVFADLSPVLHSHVARIKQWVVLEYTVENAVLLRGQFTSVGHSVVSEREREGEGERVREGEIERVYICTAIHN